MKLIIEVELDGAAFKSALEDDLVQVDAALDIAGAVGADLSEPVYVVVGMGFTLQDTNGIACGTVNVVK